jgi:predicted O-methyltransferase YrrM
MAYNFTNNWFEANAIKVWNELFTKYDPFKVLEVGSFEGKSACYLIENLGSKHDVEITCVDTWEGGEDHNDIKDKMHEVEQRFNSNIEHAKSLIKHKAIVTKIKKSSDIALPELLVNGGANQFDLVYIDGSHLACDVMMDAVLGFKLLKKDGLIIFDDYLWYEESGKNANPLRCPKLAIDAFTNIFYNKALIIGAPFPQMYLQKMFN